MLRFKYLAQIFLSVLSISTFLISNSKFAIAYGEELHNLELQLLPEKYRLQVAKNLDIAGENKAQLLLAIKNVNPKYVEGMAFLLANAPARDLKELTAAYLIDNVNLAFYARENSPWGMSIPLEIFLNNVVPYVNVTETREDWRRDFNQRFFNPAIAEQSISKAVFKLNSLVFDTFNVRYHPTKRKKPDQSPSESISIGFASCTGLSILLTDALRSVGIPARLAGISQWPETGGNHTWVEVWDNGWHYIGAAEPGEYNKTWFSEQAQKADVNNPQTSIYAVSFAQTAFPFPMVWDSRSTYVRAENVTLRYKVAPAFESSNTNLSEEINSALEHSSTIISEWNKYKDAQLNNPTRQQEFKNNAINFNGLTMKYAYKKVGNKPAAGYPLYIALHGGGGAPAGVNDSQWLDMQLYYLANIKQGIYLAPRGVTNTWNLHFVDESYVMYDRLIENMILFENVDPNKVYLLGFSAGGDGVYAISPRMNDRFAAVNMSAGHPNGISLANVYKLPFMVQVGEMDGAYSRNKIAAEYCGKLKTLQAKNSDGYIFGCNIHYQKPHNFLDNEPTDRPQKVIADFEKWLLQNDRTYVERNTNAITWLSQYTRNPLPNRIIWDITTNADRSGIDKNGQALWTIPTHGQQNYWLDIGNHNSTNLGTTEIIARLDSANNAVIVEKSSTYLKILLKKEMLNLAKPIKVIVEGIELLINVQPNAQTISKTMLDRGDINYTFEVAILLEKINNNWKLSQVD